MGQLYLMRYEPYSAISKFELDKTWSSTVEAYAKTGNWGGVETGIRHIGAYGTAWGGYTLFEAETPEALAQYQLFYRDNCAHVARITIEPVIDLDVIMAPAVEQIKSELKAKDKDRHRS